LPHTAHGIVAPDKDGAGSGDVQALRDNVLRARGAEVGGDEQVVAPRVDQDIHYLLGPDIAIAERKLRKVGVKPWNEGPQVRRCGGRGCLVVML
jgi:hypothetical protein